MPKDKKWEFKCIYAFSEQEGKQSLWQNFSSPYSTKVALLLIYENRSYDVPRVCQFISIEDSNI